METVAVGVVDWAAAHKQASITWEDYGDAVQELLKSTRLVERCAAC